MERTWKKMDRDIKEGEIIRFKRSKPDPRTKDGYIYGRAVGGFGMHMDLIGSAVFVINEAWNFEDCEKGISKDTARWERYMVEITDDLPDPKYLAEYFARKKARQERITAKMKEQGGKISLFDPVLTDD